MSEHARKPLVAGAQAVDFATVARHGEAFSAKTATRLRDICNRTGELYDGALKETQAQRRNAALRESHPAD